MKSFYPKHQVSILIISLQNQSPEFQYPHDTLIVQNPCMQNYINQEIDITLIALIRFVPRPSGTLQNHLTSFRAIKLFITLAISTCIFYILITQRQRYEPLKIKILNIHSSDQTNKAPPPPRAQWSSNFFQSYIFFLPQWSGLYPPPPPLEGRTTSGVTFFAGFPY